MAQLFVSTEEIRGLVQQTGFACTAFFAKCVDLTGLTSRLFLVDGERDE